MSYDFFESYIKKSSIIEKDTIENINIRRQKLWNISIKLKEDFVGLDTIIDKIIKVIEPWYVMPTSLRRPHIICLWGMTGVGKTDLIRKLVEYLEFNNRYLEIQMSNEGASDAGSFSSRTFKSRIEFSNIEPEEPGILFLDEIQRYRTKEENGEANQNQKDQDIWQLLSDGKFAASTRKSELMDIIYSKYMWDDDLGLRSETLEEDSLKKNSENLYKRGYYTAKKLKKIMKLSDPINEIMKWTDEYQEEVIRKSLEDPNIFSGDNYSKLLIIISGNIDEAYTMSQNVSDQDIDADVLHNFSKSINFLTVKKSLLNRFFPEQIARFGNNHIIYPSLRKTDYYNVIRKTLREISSDVLKFHNIKITFSENIEKLIYNNGVFPSQGVRPVFSTIAGSIEALLPKVIIRCIESSQKEVFIDYSNTDFQFKILTSDNQEILSDYYQGDVDIIKRKVTRDNLFKSAVHEIGHAIVYAIYFGVAPTQIEGNTSDDGINGFIGMHSIEGTRNMYMGRLTTLLAGMAAEEYVFNEPSNSSSSDLINATEIANMMIKFWGMGTDIRIKVTPFQALNEPLHSSPLDDHKDIEAVEKLLNSAKKEARLILEENSEIFIRCVELLVEKGSISPQEFKDVCFKYGLKINIIKDDDLIQPQFEKYFNNFKKKNSNPILFVEANK